MSDSTAPKDRMHLYRVIALIVAGALLNIGTYFLLFILTPLLSGAVVGFLLGKKKDGALAGFLSSIVSFLPLQLILAPLLLMENPVSDYGAFYLALLVYVLILSVFGLIGGVIGAFLGESVRKPQVSTIS